LVDAHFVKSVREDDISRIAGVNQYLAYPPALNVCLDDQSICVWVADEVDIFFGEGDRRV
jgi:hypothetical protein